MSAPTANIIQLQIGDTIPIGQILVELILMGIVTDINNPNMFAATMQAFQRQAVLTVPVLQGPPGNPGEPCFALQWQNDSRTQPSQLPTGLGDTAADTGKFWIFGIEDINGNVVATVMYIWWGTAVGWRQLPVGQTGPPGPYPIITPLIVPETWENGNGPGGASSWIVPTGTASNPTLTFHLAMPPGIPGPASAFAACPDIDFVTNPPAIGDTVVLSSRVTPGAPTGLVVTPSATGGTLAAGMWGYSVTALLPGGESAPTAQLEATTAGSTSSVALAWTQPSGGGAVGYRIYREDLSSYISEVIVEITSATTVSFTDTGIAGAPGSPPVEGVTAGLGIWVPMAPTIIVPKLYTVPEAAFTAQEGIGSSTVAVCTFAIPPQIWAYKPKVGGQLQIFGANISLTPLLVGAQVTCNGWLVSRGFGNSLGYVTMTSHGSTPTSPSTALTPSNGTALIAIGVSGVLTCSLVNEGLAGIYDFSPGNAQMDVLLIPVIPGEGA